LGSAPSDDPHAVTRLEIIVAQRTVLDVRAGERTILDVVAGQRLIFDLLAMIVSA
jgi:hypothetical protein